MFTIALSFLFACGEKSTDTAVSTETTDTAEESAEETEVSYPGSEESEGIGEMGGYLSSYCTEYALRCGVYSSEEYCVDEMSSWFNNTCVIVDTDALDTCMTWLSELSCEETGWIDECSNFYSCD
ncbi:MAG: hypothetical protein CL916_13235 [Deltaproteobacteria bacterium]|nr:hypothetical protein [Deltaproteobacteria bacterium]